MTQKSEYIEIQDPNDLLFRPIVAGPACPTNRISKLIDILLQPFLKKIKSYVRDDIQFLNYIPQRVDPDTLMVTFDVTSLYSNIPHDLGKTAISFWIEKYPEILHSRFNKQFIIDGIELILNNNSFQFNNKNYIQTLGTAMGTKMAPTYATLTLAYLEEHLYDKIEQEYGNNIKMNFIKSWKRYLDDCFIFWKCSWGDINKIHKLLQNLHPKIKFTIEHNSKELPFLDIIIKNINGQIITDIYHKPTDTQQYLHFKSHHPQNCIKSIPYALARRIYTIVTDKNLQQIRLKELEKTLLQRGYPTTLINKGFELAEKIPLEQLRTPKKHNNEQQLAYVSTYNKNNPEIFTNILHQLENNEKIKNILDTTKIIKSKRQSRNLKQILTSSKFGIRTTQGVSKCGNRRCGVCNIIIEGTTYTFKNPHTTFKINRNLDCTSKNVVYVIECTNCKKIYIGCTSSLNKRISLHKSNIKLANNRNLYVSKHIHECNQGKFKVMPLYQTDDYTLLLIKEKHFIDKYKPELNRI